jgi:arylformamidase
VTVTDIVRQTRASIGWVFRNIMRHSGNPSKLYVSGHSAGGHLTAMALAHDWEKEGLPRNLIKGAVATSGVYDLEMVMQISVQEQVRMTPEIAKQNSPLLLPPRVKCPLLIAVGGAEPKGWQQMSEDYFKLCKNRRQRDAIPGQFPAPITTPCRSISPTPTVPMQSDVKQMGL